MGMHFGLSSNRIDRTFGTSVTNITNNNITNNITPGNPNPADYRILEYFDSGDLFAVKINYPNCTNYEGNKILVFRGKFINLINQKLIDPHFCDDKTLMFPIARLEPTDEGWRMAKHLCMQHGKKVR